MINRRRALKTGLAAFGSLSAVPRNAGAQDYPARPLRLVVGFPPGTGPDILARLVAEGLSERLGRAVVIENRPGAGSNLALEAVARADPDGYTLLWAVLGNTVNATLYPDFNFTIERDITPITATARSIFVMAVHPSVQAQTTPEFIAYAKANPDTLNMASQGNGTATHIFGELFNMMAGTNLVHVPYRASFLPDLLGGQVQVAFLPIVQGNDYFRAGKLRALGVTSATRADALPDIPPLSEAVPVYEATGWQGIGAPKATPFNIIEKLNKTTNDVITTPAVKGRFADLGAEPMPMSPDEFGKFIATETKKWAKVVKFADIKPE